MLLGILTHIEAHEGDAQFAREHTRHFGLPHPSGPNEEQRGERLIVIEEARFRHLHGLDHLSHRLILSVDTRLHPLAQCLELFGIVFLHCHGIDLAHLCQHVADELLVDHSRPIFCGM